MALDRLVPVSTTPGAVPGNTYMDAVQEEITGIWDRSVITLTGVAGTNTITATVTPALTGSLVNGMLFILKPANTTTGAVTLNGDPVVDGEGTALTSANPLRVNGSYLLKWDSTFSKYVVVGFFPAAAVPVGSKLIKRQSVSAVASIDFVNGVAGVVLDGTYDAYELVINGAIPVTDDVEGWLRIGTGAGPTYQTANYSWTGSGVSNSTGFNTQSTSDAKIIMTRGSGTQDIGNASGEHFSAHIEFVNPALTTLFPNFRFHANGNTAAASAPFSNQGTGQYNVVGAITAVRFQFETGNIASATAALYGKTNA